MKAAVEKPETAPGLYFDRHIGSTGKAALEGFRDVEGTSVIVFIRIRVSAKPSACRWSRRKAITAMFLRYPAALMMLKGVKAIFNDRELGLELQERDSFIVGQLH